MSDVPAFDPDAAAKIYEAEHPEAVRDVEKARAMAMAGDRAESEAANYLEQADTALAAGAPTKAKGYMEKAREQQSYADKIEDRAGEAYDQLKQLRQR